MNPKFILPLSFALTAHVFLLFGLPGRTPMAVALPTDEPLPPKDPNLHLLIDEPVRVAGNRDDPADDSNRNKGMAPRGEDIPIPYPGVHDFEIPVLPPIKPGGGVDRISERWEIEREKTPTTGGVKNLADLDRVPRARVRAAPVYPSDLRNRGVEGTVEVAFLVDEAGNAYSPLVLTATEHGFEEAALRAVARWKFEPGFKDGRRVRYRMSVPVVFRLDRG